MAKLGKFNYSDFKLLAGSFQKALDERVVERFIREFLLEMAFRAERKIKKRTPVGVYPEGSGRTGGNLRRNWKVGNVEKQGDAYIVEIYNPVDYAGYVEYGHRTRNHKGWVEGRFMMTISMQEIERELPKYLKRKQVDMLEQILNGRPPKR
ncbi:HK97 gp10 family phage protein [Geosporobacter ferrireducens]|uniref:HK97 gp10 family phage protein n=1 Tax=Geosporobacter ferrireducens TaxID=1424294 RepID=UPI00139EAD09|nr:HK97 gp10 family phage protein [Geosporobacter ferrireducens]MTI56154.1 HK97 gp10 family phage protein [Geosporobacter ferrireducens]